MATKPVLPCSALLFCLFAVQPGVAATLCVDPSDGDCHATIQSAVDAASQGDLILISPHSDAIGYRENVVINTSGLTLRGNTVAPTANILEQTCPEVVLDGCLAPPDPGETCTSVVIEANAANTSIERILLRHGQIRFEAGSEGSALREACIVGNVQHSILTPWDDWAWELTEKVDDLTVEDSVFQGGRSYSIAIWSDNAVIRNNQFYAVDNGVWTQGDGLQFSGNTMRVCNDACTRLNGDNMLVEGNLLVGGDDGLYIRGNNPTLTNNIVEHMSDRNIDVRCSNPCIGGLISGNRVISNVDDDELIFVSGDGAGAVNFIIEDNFLALASEHAIQFTGQNSFIRRNTIHRSGTESISEACIRIAGAGANVIEDNTINLCTFNAILQWEGINNTYRNNTITGSGRAGIVIREDSQNTLIENNQIAGSHGEGIANFGSNTSVVNNVLSGNRIDICNQGTIGSFSGNSYATGGTTTDCEIEFDD
ncbi:MAG: right-handed parallel beta-helix repeat-containing protein [Wenzhouxiangella sp.]|nr:right-handed parallel beta-helix repeat-containing protein [Wenzhouxiangella sp.]